MKGLFLLVVLLASTVGQGQLLFNDDFTGYVNGNLAGQGGWTKAGSGPDVTVASASPITYSTYNGGGGPYAQIPNASGTTSNVRKSFTSTTGGTNTFYYSFLLNVTSATATGDYSLSLADPATGTAYFARVFLKSSGTGYNVGISKAAAAGTYGTTVYGFGQTYVAVVQFTFVTGATNDVASIWINPSLASEPTIGTAEASISAGSDPGLSGGFVGNIVWHNRSANNGVGRFDGLRVSVGATSAAAWTNLGAYTNPDPTTTSIDPTSATAGGVDFPLTVYGTNFVNGPSTVRWNGIARPTIFVSSIELTATIYATDIASAGSATVDVITTGAANTSNTKIFTINSATEPALTVGSLTAFGNVCINTIGGPYSSTLNGTNLTAADIVIGAVSGYSYSTSSSGPFSAGPFNIAQPGGTYAGALWVRFSPTMVQPYPGTIGVNGGGATTSGVVVSGSGVNSAPTVTTGAATGVTTTSASIAGQVNAVGCGTLISYGIEYSTTNNFVTGTGTQAPASNLSGMDFSRSLTGLFGCTTYYYRAYATSSVGTTYGNQSSFATSTLGAPVAITATSVSETGFIANWAPGVTGATGYALDVSTNSAFGSTVSVLSSNFDGGTLAGWTPGTVGDWAASTSAPLNGTHSLKHNLSGVASSSYIYAQPSAYNVTAGTTTWQLNIRPGFSPSTNNKAWYYLMANNSNLGSPTGLNGYAVGFNLSGSDDLVKLWKVTNGVADGTPIVASSFAAVTNVTIGIEVTRTAAGTWTLKYKSGGGFTTMTTAGSATDATYTNATYCGPNFVFTSSIAGALRLDDISINHTVPNFLSGYNGLAVAGTNQTVTVPASGTYYYRVRAVGGSCSSPNSNTMAVLACTAPAITSATSNSPACSNALTLSASATGTVPLTYSWSGTGTITNGNTANSSVTGAATGTYTVLVTNACGNTDQGVSATVHPLPTANASGGGTICSGDPLPNVTFTFTGAAPYNFTYDPGAVNVTGHASNTYVISGAGAGTYSVTALADGNTCTGNSFGSNVAVIVNTVTAPTCPANSATCSSTAPYALTGGTPTGGTYSGPGVSGGNFNPSVAGAGTHTITYSYTDGNGCTGTPCTFTITVTQATTWYADFDNDSFGDPAMSQMACSQPSGYVANNSDSCPSVFGVVGSACNAGPSFVLGQLNASCACVGVACTTNLNLDITMPAFGNLPSWELREAITNILVQSGGGTMANAGINSINTCLPDGKFKLILTGVPAGGAYVLRTSGNPGIRIIDNIAVTEGTTQVTQFNTTPSALSSNGAVQIPIGPATLLFTSCDKAFWVTGEYIVVNEDAQVAAAWVVNGTDNIQSATTGYDFWFYNPNGGYSFIRQRRHNVSDNFGSVGSARTCHMKVNNWASANHIPNTLKLNVRVRAVVNNVPKNWGPACRFVRDEVLAACPPTKLFDVPGSPQFFSCNVSRVFNSQTSNRLYSRPVTGANRYKFTFSSGEGSFSRETSFYYLNLGWTGLPTLTVGNTYDVTVQASFNNGATYCVVGDVCKVTIAPPAAGGSQNLVMDNNGEVALNMWPNPNRGDQLFVSLNAIQEGVNTVSLDIMDLSGKRMVARTIAAQDGFLYTVVDLNGDLAGGMYVVNVTAGDKVYTQRVVIQP